MISPMTRYTIMSKDSINAHQLQDANDAHVMAQILTLEFLGTNSTIPAHDSRRGNKRVA